MHPFPAVTEVTLEQRRQTTKQAITVRVVSAGQGEDRVLRVPSRGTIPSLKGFLRGCGLQELVKTRAKKRVFGAEGSEV